MSWFNGRNEKHASMVVANPVARRDELVVEAVNDELLVYDQRNNQAHCLSRIAGQVWEACDGAGSPAEIASATGIERELVETTLQELDSCGLLEVGLSGPGGVTRREATSRMIKVGAAAASAPLIISILAPTPAMATSEATCLKICPQDCGDCQKAGCCCCGPGNSNTNASKLCTADCNTCQNFLAGGSVQHCGVLITSVSCSAGC